MKKIFFLIFILLNLKISAYGQKPRYDNPSHHKNVLLVTVSDDRSGRKNGKYAETQDKIEAIFRNNPKFGITRFSMWKWPDIENTDFYRENKQFLDNIQADMNGRAYKPFVILEGLKMLSNGEYLIYTDVSPEIWSKLNEDTKIDLNIYNIKVIKHLCDINNNILTIHVKWNDSEHVPQGSPGNHTHALFTLDRCIQKMGLWEYRNSLQHASGMWVIRKSPETLMFVEEWLYWNLISECASLGPSNNDRSYWSEEYQNKVGHRHDQSISGLLINKIGNNLLEIPEDFFITGLNPYNFLQFTRLDVEYTFINSNITK